MLQKQMLKLTQKELNKKHLFKEFFSYLMGLFPFFLFLSLGLVFLC